MRKFSITVLILIILFLTTTLVVLLTTYSKYSKWEKQFESNINIENLVNRETLSNSSQQKIVEFTISNEDTQFLELTPSEVGQLLFSIIDQYSNDFASVNRIYIDSNKDVWNVCSEISIDKFNMSPWVCTDVNKDDIQSPQLYITDFYVGPYSLNSYGIVEKINEGISNAILTVNENGFSGRYLENITLLDNKLVVKGSVY